MKRGQLVIVGIDFSAGSAAALEQGRQFAHQFGGRVELLHIGDAFEPDAWRADPHVAAWLEAAHLLPEELTVGHGAPWVEITRRAAEAGASILVIGTHGRSGVQPVRVGATALKLTLTAPCPVMLVNGRRPRPLFSTPIRSSRAASSSRRTPPGSPPSPRS